MEEYNWKILDCTLRDGGYINDWKFGNLKSRSIVMRLDDAGIDIIECGFLDDKAPYDMDRTVFPSISAITDFFGKNRAKNAEFVAMIEYGHFDARGLIPCEESVIDGIRLIFSKKQIDEALEYAKIIKEKGYHLYINPVALFSYADEEIIELTRKINDINPICVSIVDTYGVMFWQDVVHYVELLDRNLSSGIALGMHSHNNLQMSNANTIEFLRMPLHRDKVADATLLGMGRRTGNASTEVICSYLEKYSLKNIDVDLVLESAYSDIAVFLGERPNWGYDLDNLISAIFECSTSWVQYYLKKNTMSIASIREIISSLPKYERSMGTFFTKELAEQRYVEYMTKAVNDSEDYRKLGEDIAKREVLVICPGKSIEKYEKEINAFIAQNNIAIFSTNFIPQNIHCDFCFVSNSKRATQMALQNVDDGKNISVLATSNVMLPKGLNKEYVFNYKNLYDAIDGDNSCVMLLEILNNLGIKKITVAGLDGWENNNAYVDNSLEWFQSEKNNEEVIRQLNNFFARINNVEIDFLTPTPFNMNRKA